MSDVRSAAVAGSFYPGRAGRLREMIESMVDAVEVPADDELAPAYIVPHAGYRYSGPTAAHVYARLRKHAKRVKRVVLVGPSHFVPLQGLAGSPAERWETPLGTVATPAAEGVAADAAVHEREHCLEVQLPFLQVCVGEVEVTPIAIGKSTIEDTATAINGLVDAETVLLCSTDLSHYHDEATARKLDRATADAILAAEPRRINTSDACGVFALRGTVAWAAHHGLSARELDLSTSADTAGTAERVVGYPAFSLALSATYRRLNAWIFRSTQPPRQRGSRRCRRQPCPRSRVESRVTTGPSRRRIYRPTSTNFCDTSPSDCPIRPSAAGWGCHGARYSDGYARLWTISR